MTSTTHITLNRTGSDLRLYLPIAGLAVSTLGDGSLVYHTTSSDPEILPVLETPDQIAALIRAAGLEAYRRQLVCAALSGALAYSNINPSWGNVWENGGGVTQNCVVALDIADAVLAAEAQREVKP